MAVEARLLHLLAGVVVGLHAHSRQLQLFCHIHVGVGDIDASVVDVRSSEDNILRTYFILLLGIFAAIEPCQVHHLPAAVREVSHHAFLAGTHLERLETQDVAFHLYERHVACQFADAVEP